MNPWGIEFLIQKRGNVFLFVITFCVLCASGVMASPQEERSGRNTGKILITGYVLDKHKRAIRGARIRARIDGEPKEILVHGETASKVFSSAQGVFLVEMRVPESFGSRSGVALEIEKTSFRTSNRVYYRSDFVSRDGYYLMEETITLQRDIGPAFWISALVLLGISTLISFDLLHRTIAAMLGVAVVLTVTGTIGTFFPAYQIISFETAVRKIDMNVIFLLLGMMIIVGVLKKTGVFQWFAALCFKLARGKVAVLALTLTLLSGVVSAFLDNVTTMLLLAPVTLETALALRISPLSFLIPEVLASNVGGASTLIGDPPNIMIGSYADLTFMDFLGNLALVCFIALLALVVMGRILYGKDYAGARIGDREAFVRELESKYRITDRKLLLFGLLVLALVILLFVSHGFFEMEVSVAAVAGASVLTAVALLTRKVNLTELIQKDIEWPTLLFFMFLFVIVGAAEETGLLDLIGEWVILASKGNLVVAVCTLLWVSAIVSAFVDNIPFTATMMPIAAYLTEMIPGAEGHVLWWALALGACLGGNGTLIGVSANVVTMGIAEKAGYPLRFGSFMKVGFIFMVVSVGLANIWLLVFS